MQKPIILAIFAILVAINALTVRSGRAEPAADSCITKPDSEPPQGSHWYYRVDRAADRRCWYLGPEGAKVREAESPKRLSSARSSSQPTPGSSAEGGGRRGPEGAKVREAESPKRLPSASSSSQPTPVSSADPEGTKVREAESPKRLSSARSSSQPTPESSAEGGASQKGLVADASTSWPVLPKSADITEHEPALMTDSNADKRATTDPEDEISVPTLTDLAATERASQAAAAEPETAAVERSSQARREAVSAVAEQPLLSAVGPEQMLAIAAGALALVAIIFLTIYKLLVAQKLRRRHNSRDQWRLAAKTARSRELSAAPANTVVAARQTDVVCNSIRRPRDLGVVVERINRGDASRDLEEDLRRLLHVTKSRAA
jgi:hypothetical protein